MTDKETMRQNTIEELRKMVRPGDTLYTILRHVSQSGMTRVISVYAIYDNKPQFLDWYVERILDLRRDKNREGVRITGVGMDMGYSIVYALSRALYQDRFECIGEKCPSNDHMNGDRDYTKHLHSDGGYALRHQWL